MKKEIKLPVNKTKKEVKAIMNEIVEEIKVNSDFGNVKHPEAHETPVETQSTGSTENITEKLDKIISFLNSIESELIRLDTPKNLIALSSETIDEFSLYEMSWNTLDYLHKQAADTLNRLNFHPQNIGEEFKFAKKRFDKLNEVLFNKLNQINWD